MTTIAVSTKQIAGDRQATHGGGMKFKLKTKLHSFDSKMFYSKPFHVGLAGNLDSFSTILDFFQNPDEYKKPPKPKGVEGVVLTADGNIFTFVDPSIWLKIEQPYYAIGSGMNFAIASMMSGKTPMEAVKITATLDPMTGFGVTKIDLK